MFKAGDKVVMATNTSGVIPVGAKGVVQDVDEGGVYDIIIVDFGDIMHMNGTALGDEWIMLEEELEHDRA